jgi:ABC-type antimicrobial peptide transport system permease subunit
MIYTVKFYLRIALQNLIVHKGRMVLALLGILFAVMSLVAFGNISNGMKKKIDNEISNFGKYLIILRAGLVFASRSGTRQFAESKTLKLRDVNRIKESLAGIVEVVPFFDITYPARYEDKTLTVSIVGTTDAVFKIRNVGLIMGKYFSIGSLNLNNRLEPSKTSMTSAGSNHTSASSRELTLECFCFTTCFSIVFGSFAKSSSVKPVPHFVTVSNVSLSGL